MITKTFLSANKVGLVFGAALLPLLIGCVAEPRHSSVRVHTPSVSVQAAVILEDDYVYYPGYEVYYSSHRRAYVYRDGGQWVTRPAPPRVSVDVLFASPSVRAEFRDSPERHHSDMIRRYPRNWKSLDARQEHKDDRKDDRQRDRHDDNK